MQTLNSYSLQSYTRDERSVLLDCGGPRLAIHILTPRIVRVRFAPDGNFAPRRSWAVDRPENEYPPVSFEVLETHDSLMIETVPNEQDDLTVTVHIRRDTLSLFFANKDGEMFCQDEQGIQWRSADETTNASQWRVACHKHMQPGEHFFGFGERTGPLERTGRRMTNWTTDPGSKQGSGTDPLYIAIPVFQVVSPVLCYGIYLNNTWHSAFDIGRQQSGVWRMEADGGELDYSVIYGLTPVDVSDGIGQVLGTTPMPPRWALGYHQSRWSYAPEQKVRELASEFRTRDIPCDVIHLDIGYMDGYRVFTWHPERFPDPPRLLADLHEQGFRVVTIIDPGVKVDDNYHVYREGLERDVFIRRANGDIFKGYVWPDEAVFSDYIRPDVREWWGDNHRVLAEQGVSGIWNDMNEPTSFHHPFSDTVNKKTWGTIDMDAPQGPPDEQGTHAETHNLFGWNMARAAYEGMRRHRGGERSFILTRAAFAGVQRWSGCWMGDNTSSWDHLEMSMPQLMNMGLSGVPFVGVDIGGFAGNASGELFARWMQLGALLPFSRGHTTHDSGPHEPWAFGPRVEAICRDALALRYRLLPYLYTLFWEASQRGVPVLRPLFYHFSDDPTTYHLHDQVMLGPFLMAAPMYQPGREHRYVYLPQGVWYNWWTDEAIHGPAHLLVHAPLETLPLYVYGGSIVPTGPDMRFTDEHALDPLTLHVYPGTGTTTLYEDDGHTYAYEQGAWCTTRYTLESAGSGYTLTIGTRTGGYTPAPRTCRVVLHNVTEQTLTTCPTAIFNAEKQQATLEFEDNGTARAYTFQARSVS